MRGHSRRRAIWIFEDQADCPFFVIFLASVIMEIFIDIPHFKPESEAKGMFGIVKADL